MREVHLPFPELALIAATRAALGAGIGLLVASRLSPGQRETIGWTLATIGVLSTIPLVADVLRRSSRDCSLAYDEPSLAMFSR
jgi:hypothetical protein